MRVLQKCSCRVRPSGGRLPLPSFWSPVSYIRRDDERSDTVDRDRKQLLMPPRMKSRMRMASTTGDDTMRLGRTRLGEGFEPLPRSATESAAVDPLARGEMGACIHATCRRSRHGRREGDLIDGISGAIDEGGPKRDGQHCVRPDDDYAKSTESRA